MARINIGWWIQVREWKELSAWFTTVLRGLWLIRNILRLCSLKPRTMLTDASNVMKRRNCNSHFILGPISEQEYRELFALIKNPPPGSAIEAAKEFGVDLYGALENLRLTPEERIRRASEESEFAEQVRQAGRDAGL